MKLFIRYGARLAVVDTSTLIVPHWLPQYERDWAAAQQTAIILLGVRRLGRSRLLCAQDANVVRAIVACLLKSVT